MWRESVYKLGECRGVSVRYWSPHITSRTGSMSRLRKAVRCCAVATLMGGAYHIGSLHGEGASAYLPLVASAPSTASAQQREVPGGNMTRAGLELFVKDVDASVRFSTVWHARSKVIEFRLVCSGSIGRCSGSTVQKTQLGSLRSHAVRSASVFARRRSYETVIIT